MAYVNKIIGKDEKLIGIARLHWIYIMKGVAGFFACALFGWVLNLGIYWFLSAMGRASPETLMHAGPVIILNNWLMTGALVLGIVIFCFYFLQLISTEIALTSKRVIHKRGLLFIKSNEIDMEEIRGESLDLGWMGRFLGYGFIKLDCRFIGDVRLPAIENPERFLRILHELRTKILDTVTMITGRGRPVMVDVQPPHQPAQPPRHELRIPPMGDEEKRFVASDSDTIPAAAAVYEVVHRVIEEVVPDVVEQVAEKMIQKIHQAEAMPKVSKPDTRLLMTEQMKEEGLKAQPPLEKAKPPMEEELFADFGEASTDIHPEHTVQINPDRKPEQTPPV